MRLFTYEAADGSLRPAIAAAGATPIDLEQAASDAGVDGAVLEACSDVLGFLGLDSETRQRIADATQSSGTGAIDLEAARLGPPVPNPEKILCIGLNYRDHAEETGMDAPSTPIVFGKYPNSLVGPKDDVVVPPLGTKIDYEAELAVVIGARCARVSEGEALDYVFGGMAFNDVSARDLQMASGQWTMGKAIDTFGPCGPALVSLDEISDLQDLAIKAKVNGMVVQDSNTSQMIFSVAQTVSYLSGVMTLMPGDIIATGTPAGVGFGKEPPLFLGDQDVVEVSIEGLGAIENRVVAEAGAPVAG